MNDSFEFATAGRIIFGTGRLREVGPIAASLGQRILLITGAQTGRAEAVRKQIEAAGCHVVVESVAGEPTLEIAGQLAAHAREEKSDLVVGFGGGSVIDAAKAAAALATNRQPVTHYLEVIGDGQPLTCDPLPVIAIPTTAGTGAEVTRNAVLHSPEAGVKISLRSPRMLPRVALVDPETMLSLPPAITATTGMDALTQLIESFVSVRANAMTDALCRTALPRVVRSLDKAFLDGTDLVARTDLAFASLMSGLALANAGLGAVHGLAAPLGGRFNAPHGAVCAALLAPVLQMNLAIARQKREMLPTVAKFAELVDLLSPGGEKEPEALILKVSLLTSRLGIQGLSHHGVSKTDFATLAELGLAASSMKGNPVSLSSENLQGVLAQAL